MSDRNVRFVTVKNGKFIEEIMTVPINATVSDIESKFVKWVGVTNGAFWQDIHICEKCGRQLDRQGYMRETHRSAH